MNAQVFTLRPIRWETWALNAEADRRFWRIFATLAVPVVILAIVVPLLRLATPVEKGGGALRNSSTTVRLLPTPPAPVAAIPEEPKPQPKPVEKPPQVAPVPKPEQHPVPAKQPPRRAKRTHKAPTPPKVSARARAEKLAAASGLDTLSALDSPSPTAAARKPLVTGQLTTQGGRASHTDAQAAARAFERSATQGSDPGASSTGAAPVTRAQSGHGVGNRRTATVTSSIGFGRDRSKIGASGDAVNVGRTLREIQLVFDRNKGAFYALYNHALRSNPNERGKIVVSLTIQPDGSVSDCHMVYSDIGDAALERKVLARVKMMNFGAKKVPPFTYPNYPIHFVPPS